MKIATICPTHLLDTIELEPFHMALAQYLISDTEYREFYRRLGRHGCHIIVDNGAAEGEFPEFQEVVRVADYVEASEIILPDVLQDPLETIRRARAYAPAVQTWRRMIVPQGADINEWYACLRSLDVVIGYHSIGVPKHLKEARNLMTSASYRGHPFHWLGIHSYPSSEVARAGYLGVRSLDTGVAVAYAQHDVRVKDFHQRFSLDWEASANRELIYLNINDLKEASRAHLNE